jgi:hypothetical protein
MGMCQYQWHLVGEETYWADVVEVDLQSVLRSNCLCCCAI